MRHGRKIRTARNFKGAPLANILPAALYVRTGNRETSTAAHLARANAGDFVINFAVVNPVPEQHLARHPTPYIVACLTRHVNAHTLYTPVTL